MKYILICAFFFLSTLSVFSQTKDWTFMVYMVGNNNLEPDALNDLNEMTKADSKNANIITFSDRGMNYTTDGVGGVPAWAGAKKFVVNGGKLKELANLGEIDSTNPKYLKEFIEWGVKNYPAKKYALIFWDHGGGWAGYASSDLNPEGGFTPLVLRDTISSALKSSSIKKFELMGFDACLMGNFETLSILKDLTSYYLASEELEPGHGWDYSVLKGEFDKQSDTISLGKTMVQGFKKQAETEGSADGITLSFIDVSKFGAIEKAVGDFAQGLSPKLKTISVNIGRIAQKIPRYGKAPEPSEELNLIDLGAFATQVKTLDSSLSKQSDAVIAALKAAVISSTSGSDTKGSTGLSIYLPVFEKYYDANYEKIGHPVWRNFVKTYFASNKTNAKEFENSGAKFGFASETLEMQKTDSGIVIAGSLTEGSASEVLEAYLSYGYKDKNKIVFLGSQPADIDEDENIVFSEFDNHYLELNQGKVKSKVFAEFDENDDETWSLYIPFAYFEKGKMGKEYDTVYVVVDLDEEGEIVNKTWYSISDNDTFSEFSPRKGSKIAPIVETITEDQEDTVFEVLNTMFDPFVEFDYDWKEFGTKDSVVYVIEVSNSVDEEDFAFLGD